MSSLQKTAERLLALAGIKINGRQPWDIKIRNPLFYQEVLGRGSLGLGESYMAGWWDCQQLDQFFYKLFQTGLDCQIKDNLGLIFQAVAARLFNHQSKARAFNIGQAHYDKGNDLYRAMLGKTMVYSCGYWKSAKNLDQAQVAKLDLICRKLGLKKGMRLLDVGCGWGGLLKYAAEKYGVSGVGITVSQKQAELAKKICKRLPIEIRLQDYRDLLSKGKELFDRIVSVGMFEHVGYKNYRLYFEVMGRCLKDGGLFLLHTIGNNYSVTSIDPWINKYIFPNSMLPSVKQIAAAAEGLFIMEDWHNFGANYDKTLMAWQENFEKAWPRLKRHYDQRFYRMWRYYLLTCAALFRARRHQLWQIVFSQNDHVIPGGYQAVR